MEKLEKYGMQGEKNNLMRLRMIDKKQQPIDKKKGRTSGFIPIKKIIDDVMKDIVNKRRSEALQRLLSSTLDLD